MPPKKTTRSKGTPKEPTNKMLNSNPSINKILDEIGTAHDNAAGSAFQEMFEKISELFVQRSDGKYTDQYIQAALFADISRSVAMMISRQPIGYPIKSSRPASLRQIKSEIVSEESDTESDDLVSVTSSQHASRTQVDSASEHSPTVRQPFPHQEESSATEKPEDAVDNELSQFMEVDVTPVSSPAQLITMTPTISSELTDEEFQKVLPNTVQRMQKLLISPKPTTMMASTPLAPLLRNLPRETAVPKNEFHTPSREPGPSAPMAPRTPGRQVFQFQPADKPLDIKQKHADKLRERIITEKKEKFKREEEKRNAVIERKREQERIRMEKNDAIRRKEEQRATFARIQKEMKSPTRLRLAPEAQTPASKSHSSRKVFPIKEDQVPTPGRVPAKRGRIEVVGEKMTVAQPTRDLSPSRLLTRSAPRHQTQPMPMELKKHDDLTPPVRTKHKLKAKRSVKTRTSSPVDSELTTSFTAAHEALLAEQEKCLLDAAAADRARVAEAEEEKRLEMERLEAEIIQQQIEEMKCLEEIQREEEQRLREQREHEEAELQATLARQAEKKAMAERLGKTPPAKTTAYEMTPPRTYQAKSKNDYGLNDLNSDDETDQEDDPRKEVPAWADIAVVRGHVRRQIATPPCNFEHFFGEITKPVLQTIFGETVRAKKRGSSAVWKSSPANTSVHRNPLRDIPE